MTLTGFSLEIAIFPNATLVLREEAGYERGDGETIAMIRGSALLVPGWSMTGSLLWIAFQVVILRFHFQSSSPSRPNTATPGLHSEITALPWYASILVLRKIEQDLLLTVSFLVVSMKVGVHHTGQHPFTFVTP